MALESKPQSGGTLPGFLGKLNYRSGLSFGDLIDVNHYNEDHKLFETRDMRFCRIWRLPLLNGEMVNEVEKLEISGALARVIACFPENACGQVIRYTYSDVKPDVKSWLGGLVKKEGIWKTLAESIASLHLRGARHGFLAKTTPEQLRAAEAAELARLQAADRDQVESAQEAPIYDAATRARGSFAFKNETFLTLSLPTTLAEKGVLQTWFARTLALFSSNLAGKLRDKNYGAEVEKFLYICDRIERTLEDEGFGISPLTGQELVDQVYRELNPVRCQYTPPPNIGHDKAGWPSAPLSDRLCMSPLQTRDDGWSIDGVHYRVVSAKGMPDETRPGMLMHALEQVESEGWAVVNFSVPEQGPIRLQMRMRNSVLAVQAEQKSAFLAPDPIKFAKDRADLQYVQNQMNPDEIHTSLAVNISAHIVVKDRDGDRAWAKARRLEDLMWKQGYAERMRGDAVIHHALPFNCRPQGMSLLRRHFPVLSENVADLVPLYNGYPGVSDGKLLFNNAFGAPIPFDFFTKEVTAPHALVVGGTGTGKSFLVVNLLQQLKLAHAPRCWIIDKGGSYESLCAAQGGEYLSLHPEARGGKKPRCLSPLHLSSDDTLDEKVRSELAMNELGAPLPTVEEYEMMQAIIVAMMKNGTADSRGQAERVSKEEMNIVLRTLKEMFNTREQGRQYTLTDFCTTVQHVEGGKRIADSLFEFTSGGIYGAMFDGKLDMNWENEFIVVDIAPMEKMAALDVVMLVLLRQIENYCKYKLNRATRKVIAIDEAWAVLAAHAKTLGGWFRELRKYAGSVTLISQTLGDFSNIVNAEGQTDDGIFANTRHFIFLGHNPRDIMEAQKLLKITDTFSNVWRSTRSVPPFFSEFFYVQVSKNSTIKPGIVRLFSNPVGLWVATSDAADYAKREDYTKQISKESGVSLEAARVQAIMKLAAEYPYGVNYAR